MNFQKGVGFMGLIRAAVGAAGCTLADQWKEFFYCEAMDKEVMVCRIKEGKRLLAETDLSLSQIAAILGFSSSSYFSQTFRNAEGTSPTEYRKANQVKF